MLKPSHLQLQRGDNKRSDWLTNDLFHLLNHSDWKKKPTGKNFPSSFPGHVLILTLKLPRSTTSV